MAAKREQLKQLLAELETVAVAACYQLAPLFEFHGSTAACAVWVSMGIVSFDALAFLTSLEGAMNATHELGHIAMGHNPVSIRLHERVQKEEEAWGWARKLFERLELPWNGEHVGALLADYRQGTAAMLLCEKCQIPGEEVLPHMITCRKCGEVWGFHFDGTTERTRLGNLDDPLMSLRPLNALDDSSIISSQGVVSFYRDLVPLTKYHHGGILSEFKH